jgi:hypothetical protein
MKLGPDDQMRFVQPVSKRVLGSGELSDLFDISPVYTAGDGGLPYMLRRLGVPGHPGSGTVPQVTRLADAVAVAGLEAMTENRRRAVLLVLSGDETQDASRYDAATVRHFLAAIRVPLHVWILRRPATGSLAADWGPSTEVAARADLRRAVDALRADLDSQRIVMVDGRLLPQSISLGPAARDVELVAGGPR